MSRTIFATFRNALTSLSSITRPALQTPALQPLTHTRGFRPLRHTTVLPPERVPFGGEPVPLCPAYPYGPRQHYKEADRGLYGGAVLQFGNKISKGKNKGRTRRKWYPNVRLETIRSEALNTEMNIPITAACMRTIRKCGGLDQYLLGDKPARIKELGLFGWKLRWRVMNSKPMMEKFAGERKNFGLPPMRPQFESFEQAWENDEELRNQVREEQEKQWQELREKDERFRQHVKSRWESKDKTKYQRSRVVPEFDKEAFEALSSGQE